MADLSEGYLNPKTKLWITTHFSEVIKQPYFQIALQYRATFFLITKRAKLLIADWSRRKAFFLIFLFASRLGQFCENFENTRENLSLILLGLVRLHIQIYAELPLKNAWLMVTPTTAAAKICFSREVIICEKRRLY